MATAQDHEVTDQNDGSLNEKPQNEAQNETQNDAQDKAQDGTEGQSSKPEKTEQDGENRQVTNPPQESKKGPAGGFDSTPIPRPPPGTIGYTIKITFHRAVNLAMGDAHVLSSDPYCLAQLNTGLPMRHREDPNLRFRTATVRRNTDPEWSEEWIVANVPSTGFRLKVRVYDEDPADHDDMLGKVHISVPSISDNWPGIKNQQYQLSMRDSSKRALMIRAVATCFRFVNHFRGDIYVSIESLGRTKQDGQNGRAYTVGPCRWIRHYSPLLGRLTHIDDPTGTDQEPASDDRSKDKQEKQIRRYNFQANEMQLEGAVPPELYHRFVEFKPWVKLMFTTRGLRGIILGKALHHQHARVYNFDRTTLWGSFNRPCIEMTQQFLELVHYDQGGRIFTYVLTLDALWRFTETGKEFGVDMLSKHTMHSDVSIYIAFSGEFFVRKLKHRHRPPPPHPTEATSQQTPPDHAPNEVDEEPVEEPSTDPSHYELVIDNDSGTYRPNAKMLPILASFLAHNLPGLHIMTLDCNADADKMAKMKDAQRARKKREGDDVIYTQGDQSSISSSENERLDEIEAGVQGEPGQKPHVSTGGGDGKERGHLQQAAKDMKLHQKEKADYVKRVYSPGRLGGESSVS